LHLIGYIKYTSSEALNLEKICLVVKAYKRHGSLDTFSSGVLSTGQCLRMEKVDGSGSMDVSENVKYLPAKDRSAFIFRG
jgi:hypothetical protein